MAGVKVAETGPPDRGLNVSAAPARLRDGESPVFTNLLTRYAGKATMRGPLTYQLDTFGSASNTKYSVWTQAEGYFLIGRSDDVSQISMVVESVMAGTTPSTPTGMTDMFDAYAQLSTHVWGAVQSAGDKTLMQWDPGVTPTYDVFANCPLNFTDLAAWLDRLIVLGGEPPGGGTNNAYTLYYSDVGGPVGDTTAKWQDDVSGLTNQKQFQGIRGVPTALALCGRSLAILTDSSVYLVTGTEPANWQIRLISASYGCRHPGSIVEVEDGFYYLSDQGYVFTDGAAFRIVSDPVSPLMDQIIGSFLGVTTTWVSACQMGDEYITIAYKPDDVTIPIFEPLLFNTRNETWSRFSSDLATDIEYAYSVGNKVLYHDGNRYAYNASRVTRPDQIQLSEELEGRDTDGDTVFNDIIPVWRSRLLDLDNPNSQAQLNRIVVDYAFRSDYEFDDPVTNAWEVSLLTPAGTDIITPYTVPAQTDQLTTIRLRYVIEVHQEFNQAYVELTWAGSSNAHVILDAEIHNVYVEYQPTRLTDTFSVIA